MLYAKLPSGEKGPPTERGQRAICTHCDDEVIAKCGQIVRPHWSHKADRDCDPWGEPEGEWHRGWKELVRIDQCEVTMKRTEGGVVLHHRADIVGDRGVVIELQHSSISSETIQAREAFYGRMVWVFDMGWIFEKARPNLLYDGVSAKRGSDRFVHELILDDEPTLFIGGRGGIKPSAIKDDHCLEEGDFDSSSWGVLREGSHFLKAWDSSIRVRWFHSQKSLEAVRKPLYFDFGRPIRVSSAVRNLQLDSKGLFLSLFEEAGTGPSMMRVTRLATGRVEGRLVDRREFLRRHLVGSLRSDELALEVRGYSSTQADRVRLFRGARHMSRLKHRERVERKRLADEERVALLARRQAEDSAAREKQKAKFESWLATTSLSDLLSQSAILDHQNIDIERKLQEIRSARVTELLQLPPIEWAAARGKIEFKLSCLRERVKVHQLLKDGDTALIVRGPFDQRLIPRVRKLKFDWDKGKRWWRWNGPITRERKLQVKRVLDDCNEKLILDGLSTVDRFEHDCLNRAEAIKRDPEAELEIEVCDEIGLDASDWLKWA